MKQKIRQIVTEAANSAHAQSVLPSPDFPEVEIEEPKIETHGDFSTNLAMVSARTQKMAPRKIAQAMVDHIKDPDNIILKTEIAGPGFVNFFIEPTAWHPLLSKIHGEKALYGASDVGHGEKVQIEFVSSNPTGPLHVGHGRGAAVGDSVARILDFCGFDVQKEYYINDSGRQIHTLGRSVFLRYQEVAGHPVEFPEECYQGDYIRDYAERIRHEHGDDLLKMAQEEAISLCARFAARHIVSEIKTDLVSFGVEFDQWFSEQSLYDSGRVDHMIEAFREKELIYEKEGAFWFNTSRFGDEKDRVVVRQNGQTTYFASDIAYHQEKFERGFNRVVDVWGADHHGYIPRLKACVEASGYDRDQFQVILVQLVNLLRDGEPVAMSTRAGEFITLKDVINEVGSDAARFIFLTRHFESPLDFDLELAKRKSNDNPVYYVQYVHARISSIVRKGREKGVSTIDGDADAVSRLTAPEEIGLIKSMARYPEIVAGSARMMEPHRVTYHLMELSAAFHAYYNRHRVLTEDTELTAARLYLVLAVQQVIRNGLTLLSVTAPDRM